jgi:ribosome-associated protein
MMKKPTGPRKTARPRRKIAAKPKAPAIPGAAASEATSASHRLLRAIVRGLDEKKAEDVRVFHVAALSSITDYLVLATATSEPHQRALRVELEKVLDAAHAKILGIDTSKGSGWTVVDAFEVMVHVFTAENREKYRLDLLWKDAEEVAVARLLRQG